MAKEVHPRREAFLVEMEQVVRSKARAPNIQRCIRSRVADVAIARSR